jgi:hypothetical protein
VPVAAPDHFNHNHLTELQYDVERLWPVLLVGLMLSALLMAIAALPATADRQRALRLVAATPASAAFIAFGLYWLWL